MEVEPGDRTLRMGEPLEQLRGGMRGFHVTLAQPVELQVGDELLIL